MGVLHVWLWEMHVYSDVLAVTVTAMLQYNYVPLVTVMTVVMTYMGSVVGETVSCPCSRSCQVGSSCSTASQLQVCASLHQ